MTERVRHVATREESASCGCAVMTFAFLALATALCLACIALQVVIAGCR
jgi:hypothetical protein